MLLIYLRPTIPNMKLSNYIMMMELEIERGEKDTQEMQKPLAVSAAT